MRINAPSRNLAVQDAPIAMTYGGENPIEIGSVCVRVSVRVERIDQIAFAPVLGEQDLSDHGTYRATAHRRAMKISTLPFGPITLDAAQETRLTIRSRTQLRTRGDPRRFPIRGPLTEAPKRGCIVR